MLTKSCEEGKDMSDKERAGITEIVRGIDCSRRKKTSESKTKTHPCPSNDHSERKRYHPELPNKDV